MKPKEFELARQLLGKVTSVEELAEVERVIEEAKGTVQIEPNLGFWAGKSPCWDMFRCPEALRRECPAFHYRSLPCWEIEGTYCKLYDSGTKGDSIDLCQYCRVYKKWGHGEPIEIRLFGKEFDPIRK